MASPNKAPQGAPQSAPQGAPQAAPQGAPLAAPQGAPLAAPQDSASAPQEAASDQLRRELEGLRAERSALQARAQLAEEQRDAADRSATGLRADLSEARRQVEGYQDSLTALRADLSQARREQDGHREAADRLRTELEDEREHTRALRADLDQANQELQDLRAKHAVAAEEAERKARPGYVLARAKAAYVVAAEGRSFSPRQVAIGEQVEVPVAEFRRDQALRFPHLETEEAYRERVAAQRQQQTHATAGHIGTVVAGFNLSQQMEEVRRAQLAVNADMLRSAQALPPGPLPRT